MDEQTYLRMLEDNPGDEQLRLEYFQWLEATGDNRAEYVRLMRRRLRLQKKLIELDWKMQLHWPPVSIEWLDTVFPLLIRSPTVGRCYTSSPPDSPPFVTIGDTVTPDTVVCLIETMEIFNEITAGVDGIITEIMVTNGDPVEYNQLLFRVSRPPDLLNGWW